MRRLPLGLRLGGLFTLAGVILSGTIGWGAAERARAASRLLAGEAAGAPLSPLVVARGTGAVTPPGSATGSSGGSTNTAGAQSRPAVKSSGLRVKVEEGDTLFAIAHRYRVELADLLKVNAGVVAERILPGQELALPASAISLTGANREVQPFQGLFDWPLDGPLTSPFGPRWGRFHAGIDFAAALGTPIRAARDGTITQAGELNDYGLAITLTHADGTQTLYGHCSILRVKVGDWVKAGQVIGEVGSTGLSTGPHLHFEIRVNGQPRDPLLLLSQNG
jgi:murein DD-endopeptidase MepM/ murein hydrolase activator NlpD